MDLKQLIAVHHLIRALKLGPRRMLEVSNHTTKNLAAIALLTVLLGFSVTVFSGGINLGIFGAGLLSVTTSLIVGIVGGAVNFVLPSPREAGAIDATADNDTNKFVTYSVLSFLMTVATFVVIGFGFLAFGSDSKSLLDWMIVELLWTHAAATIFISALCALVGTSILFLFLKLGDRIEEMRKIATVYFISTVLLCGIVFHLVHFVFFS